MGRSVKKGPFVAPELIKRVNELRSEEHTSELQSQR